MDPEEAARLLTAEYSRMAWEYDRDAAPYHAPMVGRILELAALSPGERVLDLGCGTGDLALEARRLIGDGGAVAGIDLAEGMIAVAAAKADRLGWRNVRFEVMDNRTLAFPDGAFDAVLSCLGIASLGHERCLREVCRVLRDDGRFVFCHWSGTGSEGPSVVALLVKYRPVDVPAETERLLEARRAINATGGPAAMRSTEAVRETLRRAGFQEVESAVASERIVYPTPAACLARALAWGDNEREFRLLSSETRHAFLREFEETAAPFVTREGLVARVGVNYFVARK